MQRLDQFMAAANARYYEAGDPFREFTTAPEICQAFGEILGLWAAVVWAGLGRPDPVLLVELGPGRGTLMADALRAAAKAAPDFRAALRLHLVETSSTLRKAQKELLPEATWHPAFEDVPPGPMLLLANEFLDALPIRQFIHRPSGWTERFVTDDGRFFEQPAAALVPEVLPDMPLGAVFERCEPALHLAALIGSRLRTTPGAALFIDYGPAESAPGESLQALRHGRPANPLAEPGRADLSAHVDFQAFAAVARHAGAVISGPLPQGLFLARLGLFQRLDRLARGRDPEVASALLTAGRRLTEPDAMGRLFKVLGLSHPDAPELPGFSP
ncbi:MAG TPA: SAM-dependent methyltransferase [Acetobacteraceae bacterium]|nr:SAM-dependent methyltransferase [Acetobacteraceae bacterium]